MNPCPRLDPIAKAPPPPLRLRAYYIRAPSQQLARAPMTSCARCTASARRGASNVQPLLSLVYLSSASASVSPSSSLREVDDDQSQDLFVPHATQLAKTGMHGHATLLRQSISPVTRYAAVHAATSLRSIAVCAFARCRCLSACDRIRMHGPPPSQAECFLLGFRNYIRWCSPDLFLVYSSYY